MAGKTTFNPQYWKYSSKEAEALLDKVAAQTCATPEAVRAIVSNYDPSDSSSSNS